MRLSLLILPLAAVALVPFAASAEEPATTEKAAEAYIAFANHGGVRDWQAYDQNTIYFQDRQKRWYKAELLMPAFDLPYTIFIGLDTEPGGRLDKWSAVYVEGQRYTFRSFVAIEGKPPKKPKKGDKEAAEGTAAPAQ